MGLRLAAAALVGVALLLIAPAWALATTFNFSDCSEITTSGVTCPNADSTKNTIVYSVGGLTITTYGYMVGSPNTLTDLYVKNTGSGEMGLGIANDPLGAHEISAADFVNLDLSNLSSHGINNGTLTLDSVQSTEQYEICFGNTIGSLGGSCISGTGGTTVTKPISWSSSNPIIGIDPPSSPSGDVLVASSLVTAVPEPGSMALFGTGLAGAFLLRRRRSAGKVTPGARGS